jgi:hypothetical protein
MPRVPTNNRNAEAAVQAFTNDLTNRGWGLSEAWLAISRQLMTCEIWDERRKTWVEHYNQRKRPRTLRKLRIAEDKMR